MGNFLLVVAGNDAARERAGAWFDAGVATTRELERRLPRHVMNSEGVRLATFPRDAGTGGQLVIDADNGDWLCAIGTWLHTSGIGPGSERKLLARLWDVGVEEIGRELEGFFVIAAGQQATGRIVVVTDLIGSCHAFVREEADFVAIGGSARTLSRLAPSRLDPTAVQEYLHTGIVYEDRTPYAEIRKLAPSSWYAIDEGRLSAPREYWSMGELADDVTPAASAIEVCGEALIDATGRLDTLFKRCVCDLTGGFDSRALAALLRSAGMQFETTVSGPADSADVTVSTRLAARCGFTHHHIEPEAIGTLEDLESAMRRCDGEVNVVAFARIAKIHEQLSEKFDLSLNGSFGEVARGYWWELLFPGLSERSPLDAERIARHRYAAGAHELGLFPPDVRIDLVEHFADVIRRTNAQLPAAPRTFQLDHSYLRMRMRCWQGRIASATNRIWPCLSPFMFRSALEPLLSSEPRSRLRGLLVRMLLERYQPEMAAFPLADGYPALPMRWSNLHRFAPLGWVYAKKVLKRLVPRRAGRPTGPTARERLLRDDGVRAVLDPRQMRLAEYLDPDGLAAFLRASESPGFTDELPWERLLSLELAVRD